MNKKLRQFADFRYGYHTNKNAEGDIKYLTAKHFDDDFRMVDEFDDSFINRPNEKILNKFLLKNNDIIITGKGYRIFAWSYDSSYGDCIPSSLFYKISLDAKIILSKYFELQFNMFLKDKYINSNLEGSTIPTLRSKDLLETPVIIPSIKEQEEIIKLWEIMERQLLIEKKIIEKIKLRNEIQFKKIYKGL